MTLLKRCLDLCAGTWLALFNGNTAAASSLSLWIRVFHRLRAAMVFYALAAAAISAAFALTLWVQYRSKPRPYLMAWSDRKSTRLNSSHVAISYAVFCLKKKNN